MNLRELISNLDKPVCSGDLSPDITTIAYDSRKVKPGSAFVALRGVKSDGHDYITKALELGASAIFAETAPPEDCKVAWIHVRSTRVALAVLATAFYNSPANDLTVCGVTGTNGKTTIAFLLHHLLNHALMRCGLLGTVVFDVGGQIMNATHTTPESLELQELFSRMRKNGCRAASIEVSSHALDQERVHGVPFAAAIFTNLTQDHLDYHHTMEEYFEAKMKLFDTVAARKDGKLIINSDDTWGRRLIQKYESHPGLIRYGLGVQTDYRATNVRYDLTGTQFELEHKGRGLLVRSPLIGGFNVYNTLAAVAAAHAVGCNLRDMVTAMKSAPQVPGRLERVFITGTEPFQVFVDYAHTPDAIINVLKTVRQMRPARVITVFGCGGDRDRTKRPLMARAAEEGSDVCVLTSDNPRTEDPKQIIEDARKGFGREGHALIVDRKEAIHTAVGHARRGDIIIIAGKGHESYQDIQGVKHPFDDRQVAKYAMNDWMRDRADRRMEESEL
jgi:UDP-N-acetylmuramoyl-L-alanyl-D-glutamate--2,6-diaminopimelate ligase